MNINVTGWLPVNDVKSIKLQQLDLLKKIGEFIFNNNSFNH